MGKANRKKELLELIRGARQIQISELQERVDCSRATMQRDLAELEQNGWISRNYGTVRYLECPQEALLNQLAQMQTGISNIEEKTKIGHAAQQLIHDQDTVFITHGSTTRQILNNLDKNDKQFTVLTDGIDILCKCASFPNIRTFMIGGLCNYNTMQLEYAPFITATMDNINVQKLIMGAAGVSLTNGVTFYDYASFQLLNSIVDRVDEIIVVADSTKFGKNAMVNCIPIEKIKTIVTDRGIDSDVLEGLKSLGIRCILV